MGKVRKALVDLEFFFVPSPSSFGALADLRFFFTLCVVYVFTIAALVSHVSCLHYILMDITKYIIIVISSDWTRDRPYKGSDRQPTEKGR